jgi:UPF0755 protein
MDIDEKLIIKEGGEEDVLRKIKILPIREFALQIPLWFFVVFFVIISFLFYYFLLSPPSAFPTPVQVNIESKASPARIGIILKEAHIIRSSYMFRFFARIQGTDTHLNTGIYRFEKPLGVLGVLSVVAEGRHGVRALRVTLTEGMTVRDMAQVLKKSIPGFDGVLFEAEASTSEGYLFPDTYFVLPSDTPEAIIVRLRAQFDKQVKSIDKEISNSKHSLNDIVIMASLIEREANTPEDKKIISGILWNRIRIRMPLQVDAVFGYIHKKNGYTPTRTDLESNSAYNTYRKKGLPPSPIANPGLDSLLAAARPDSTSYFYYLTGKDGKMYYGKTFSEHKRNRILYLD